MHKSAEHMRHDPGAVPMSGAGVSRRIVMNMLISTPVVPAAVATAGAQLPERADPIFNAIEAHKRAILKVWPALEVFNEVEARTLSGHKASTPELDEVEAHYNTTIENVSDRAQDMLDTTPTTAAGLAAFLAYVDGFMDRHDEWEMPTNDWPKVAFRRALIAAREMLGASVLPPTKAQ